MFTNWHRGKAGLERQARHPVYILDGMKQASIDGIALTQFGEAKEKMAFEQISAQAEECKLGGYQIVKKLENALVFADKDRQYEIIKGQEVYAPEGHVLVIGAKKTGNLSRKPTVFPSKIELNLITKDPRFKLAVKGPAHPNGRGGIGMENLRNYRESFDFFEGKNACYEHPLLEPQIGMNHSTKELEEISGNLGLNWIATSDCHFREDLGNGYIELTSLDFSNEDSVIDSLKDVLVNNRFDSVVERATPVRTIFRHIGLWLYDSKIRAKLGWTVEE